MTDDNQVEDDKAKAREEQQIRPAAETNTEPEASSSEEDDGPTYPVKKQRSIKYRRVIRGNKADLYSHFETLTEKAFTKGGKDLGLYLCICKYCQASYERAKERWNRLTNEEKVKQKEPEAPQPFPRTKRYCVNHQKQCPNIPVNTAQAVVAAHAHSKDTTAKQSSIRGGNGECGTAATNVPKFAGAAPVVPTNVWPSETANVTQQYHRAIMPATFEVFVAKDTFKFNAAHFVAFEGYRERLHGHNYTVGVRLQGSPTYIGPDGYVIDYGNIKKVCKEVCKDLNEHFLCPIYSNVLKIHHQPERQMVRIDCPMDGTYFEFPTQDCKFLPIVHATTEELAIYLWSRVMERLDANFLMQRGIASMELTVAEAPGQQATFRYPVQAEPLDVRSFVRTGSVVPGPCLNDGKTSKAARRAATRSDVAGTDSNHAGVRFSTVALSSLTNAMKAQGLLVRDVTPGELQTLMHEQDGNLSNVDIEKNG